MNLIVDVMIWSGAPGVHTTMTKQYDTDLVPVPGMLLEDRIWEKPIEIKTITINPEEGYYYMDAPEENSRTKEEHDQTVERYRFCGWKNITETR
ncbi:MAG: hypothetical protein ACLQPD_05055 [Desulfomonilaceae bacterium]